jgi:hypothetical protein
MLTILIVGFVVVVGAAIASRFRAAAGRRVRTAAAAADARRWYERLGSEVGSLNDDGSPVARQALSDASERYVAAGSGLGSATTEQEFRLARRTALEGLYFARTARAALGLDPGPQIPLIEEDTGTDVNTSRPTDGAGGLGGQLAHNPLATGAAGLGIGLLAGELLGGRGGGWGEGGGWGDGGDGGDGGDFGGDWG